MKELNLNEVQGIVDGGCIMGPSLPSDPRITPKIVIKF
ncbi:hypothetical protein PALI_a3835 [Pseudoalteromonas aliena SW19]|jgi:hypothetical protein|uniref:Uncharacterized protein n=1 Tax=Pseudoalteromonas aliena SW19 TaxID=1314866 RepID=A0ABR9DUS4_9GAMM|nr:hypothetical protein [Pseudoalteromonas aliena SW19]